MRKGTRTHGIIITIHSNLICEVTFSLFQLDTLTLHLPSVILQGLRHNSDIITKNGSGYMGLLCLKTECKEASSGCCHQKVAHGFTDLSYPYDPTVVFGLESVGVPKIASSYHQPEHRCVFGESWHRGCQNP